MLLKKLKKPPPAIQFALRQFAPVAGQDPGNRFVAAIAVRLEHRCLAFADVEPVLAERIHDVRLVRHDHGVGAFSGHLADELAKGLRAPVVLVRRDDEAALGDVGRGFDVAEAQQCAGVNGALEHAGLNLPHRDPEFAHRLADRFCQRTAFVVELALLGDISRIERVGVGLIRIGRAVAENDHVPALAQGVDPFRLRCRRLAVGRSRQQPKQRTDQSQSDDGHEFPPGNGAGSKKLSPPPNPTFPTNVRRGQ